MAERLRRLEGVNILKGRVRVEWVEWGHVAAENTREHQRMLRMKFYVTDATRTYNNENSYKQSLEPQVNLYLCFYLYISLVIIYRDL